jgi:hypothetical protein
LEEAEWYINQRHNAASLQKSWSRIQQQRWIASLYEKYKDDIDKMIAITSMSKADIEQQIRILKIKDYIKLEEVRSLLTNEEYEKAIMTLNYMNRFIPLIKFFRGKATHFFQALVFVYNVEGIDLERLFNQTNKEISNIIPWNDTNTAIQSIEEMYNHQLGLKSRIYIFSEYRKAMQEQASRKNIGVGVAKDYKIGDRRNKEYQKRVEKMKQC